MPKFLADENFDGRALREIRRRLSSVEIIRVQDVQLQGIKDELILEWAATYNYVVLTHDVNTMTFQAYHRIDRGLLMPGMVVIRRLIPVGQMVTELELLIECTRQDEWEDIIWFIPF